MPASATITAFNTFSQNTRAKSSQVNANFQNFRGHLVPINWDSVSASDLTHDLGSDEHRWRYGYMQGLDLETATTTATLLLQGDTTATLGAFQFMIEGVEQFRVVDTGPKIPYARTLKFAGNTTTCDITMQTVSATIGGMAFLMNGSIIFAFSTYGAEHQYFQPRTYSTTGAATSPAAIIQSNQISYDQYPAGATNIANSTCTIQTVGRPVRISFASGYYGVHNSTSANLTLGLACGITMCVLRDGTTIGAGITITTPGSTYVTSTAGQNNILRARYGPGLLAVDLNPGVTSGASNYYLQITNQSGTPNEYAGEISGRLVIETIY